MAELSDLLTLVTEPILCSTEKEDPNMASSQSQTQSPMKVILPVILAFCGIVPGTAATIIGTLSATITSIDESSPGMAPSGLAVGSTLIVNFSYLSTAAPDGTRGGFTGYPGNAEYSTGLDLSLTMTGGGHQWQGSSSSSYALIMDNGGISGTADRFDLEVRRSFGGVFSSFPGDVGGDSFLAFAIQDTIFPYILTNSLLLPTSLSDLDLSEVNSSGVVIYSPGSYSITAQPNLATLSIVPEPSCFALTVSALMFTAFRRQRFTRQIEESNKPRHSNGA